MVLFFLILLLALTFIAEFIISRLLINDGHWVKRLSLVVLIVVGLTSLGVIINSLSPYSILLAFVSWFRLVNLSRITAGKMRRKELYQRYLKTSVWLIMYSVVAIALIYGDIPFKGLSTIQHLSAVGATLLLLIGLYSIFKWRNHTCSEISITDLPTVSVCVPARNETVDLPGCIDSILASSYPKLEILVLDDCSHDKTPAIIKEFAHRGVRFITGEEPDDNWLAKNAAMSKLFKESSGDIVIFAGVDVRFSVDTVLQIIEQMQDDIDMISILPLRDKSKELTVFIQPLRYWWELMVAPIFGHPASLSTCWAIKSETLHKIGGFEGYAKSVQPEAHFAKRLLQKYQFILAGCRLGVSSVKRPKQQYDTALRKKYPQARHRPEIVFIIILAEFIIFLFPWYGLIAGLISADIFAVFLSLSTIIIVGIINTYISYLVVSKSWILGLVSLYYLVPLEWYLLLRSMLGYEFGTILWKERKICLPMLEVQDSLPKI